MVVLSSLTCSCFHLTSTSDYLGNSSGDQTYSANRVAHQIIHDREQVIMMTACQSSLLLCAAALPGPPSLPTVSIVPGGTPIRLLCGAVKNAIIFCTATRDALGRYWICEYYCL
jgi:hypothetical protein